MRILVLNYEFPPLGGGAGNATACLAREWASMGHEVEILTSGFRGLPREEVRDGYSVRRIRSPRAKQGQCSVVEMMAFMALACAPALSRAASFQPDVLVPFFGIPSGPAAFLVKLFQGIPYVVSLRGGDVPGFDEKHMGHLHKMTAPLTSLLWRNAAAVVANSRGLRETAERFAPELPILEFPNGVDTALYHPRDGAGGPETQSPRILFVGRLAKQKGVDFLLDALALVKAQSWSLTIAGDGPERVSLEAQAAALGIIERVHFRGWTQREELPELYRNSDVFAFPSHDEGMPNVVLEAMSSGLPIVATRVPGNDELVRDNGLLVPPGEAGPLAEALRTVLRDTQLRARMAERSRAMVVAQFAWARPAAQYAELFQSITRQRRGGGGN